MIYKYLLLLIIFPFSNQTLAKNGQDESTLDKLQEKLHSIGDYYQGINEKLNTRLKFDRKNFEK